MKYRKCAFCDLEFNSKEALKRHRHKAHSIKLGPGVTVEFIVPWNLMRRNRS